MFVGPTCWSIGVRSALLRGARRAEQLLVARTGFRIAPVHRPLMTLLELRDIGRPGLYFPLLMTLLKRPAQCAQFAAPLTQRGG